MLKKIMSLALALVIVVSMFALPVDAAVGDYRFYEYEPNNSTSTADRVSSGYTILGSVGQYDLDYYKFTLSSRSTVTLVGAASYSTLYMGINDSSDKVLYAYQPTYSGSGYSFAKSVTLNAGTYYLCVLSSNSVSYSKTYTLYLEYSTSSSHTHSYSAATCTKPATCSCGATTGSAAGHKYSAATCTTPKTCTVCGMTSGSVADHSYQAATCTAGEYCTVCGITGEPALGHIYAYECDATCDRCGEEREAAEHIYANGCDATCDICEAERDVSHSYPDNCADTCEICGQTRVAPHEYDNSCDSICNACELVREVGDHEYDNACDESCNICDEIRTTEGHKFKNDCDTKCDICGFEREITHKYKTITVKATLTENGSVTEKCSVCDKVKSTSTIKAVKSFELSTTTYTYNGESKKPKVTVKDSSGKKLEKDTDYTVSYPSGSKKVGKHKVTVKLKGKYSGSKTLTFTVNPTKKTSASMFVGDTTKIGAKSHTSIKYSTSDKDVATVSSKGTITAKKAGSATISVKSGDITKKIKVTVKKPKVEISGSKSMMLKKSVTLKAKTNCDAKVTWSSSDKDIASVSSSGKVTGKKAGKATITAKITYADKTYTDKLEVTVKKPTVDISGDKSVLVKKSITLKAKTNCDAKVSWSSSDKDIATVSSSGKVTGKKGGKVTITAKITYADKTYTDKFVVTVKWPPEDGITDTKKIHIDQYAFSEKYEFTLTGKSVVTFTGKVNSGTSSLYMSLWMPDYSTGFSQSVYQKDGKFTKKMTLSAGKYTLYYDASGVDADITVKTLVKPHIYSTTSKEIGRGYKIQLKAVGVKNGGTWSSSDTSIATVSSKGVVTGKKNGSCTIYCKLKDGTKLSYKVKVVNPLTITVSRVADTTIYNEAYITFTNYASKDVDYVEFQIYQYDYKGRRLSSPYSYFYYDGGIKANSNISGREYWVNDNTKTCKISIREVKYTDGTYWRP